MKDILSSFKNTRKIAADSFYAAIKNLLTNNQQISEVMLRDAWLKELRKHKDIFPNGWYIPPPHGISVLFATELNNQRTSFKSLRPEAFWPKDNVYFDNNGIITFYASPVNKKTGMIGDFGAILYLGKNTRIQDHFKRTYELTQKIYKVIEIGMKFSDVYSIAEKIMEKDELYSDLASPTDPTGTNIGHTLVSFTEKELTECNKNNWEDMKDIVSKKRIFLNTKEQTRIKPNMGITIEPRPQRRGDQTIPMALFHTVALFDENGKKELVTGFNEIFKLLDIHYL